MKSLINIDCLGTYNVEQTKKICKYKFSRAGGVSFLAALKIACARNLKV
jgi:glutamate formiminotransferase